MWTHVLQVVSHSMIHSFVHEGFLSWLLGGLTDNVDIIVTLVIEVGTELRNEAYKVHLSMTFDKFVRG